MPELPTQEVVIRDGQPIWRICAGDLCVEGPSGTAARAEFDALCGRHGIKLFQGPTQPERGPSEVDEPGFS